MKITPPLIGETQPPEFVAYDEIALREPRLLTPGMQPLGPVKLDESGPFGDKIIGAVLPKPKLWNSLLDGATTTQVGNGVSSPFACSAGIGNYTSCVSVTGGCAFILPVNTRIKYNAAGAPITLLAQFVKSVYANQGGPYGIPILGFQPTGSSTYFVQISDYTDRPGVGSSGFTGANRSLNNAATGNYSGNYNKPITAIAWIENGLWNFQTTLTYAVAQNSDGGVSLNETTWSAPTFQQGTNGWTSSPGGQCLLFGAAWLKIFDAATRRSLLDNPYQFLIPA